MPTLPSRPAAPGPSVKANRSRARGASRVALGTATLVALGFLASCFFGKRLDAAPAPAESATKPTADVLQEKVIEYAYDGALRPGWQDWGWGTHDLSQGPARINMTGYGGIILHHDASNYRFGSLVFRVKAPAAFGDFLQVNVGDKTMPSIDVPRSAMVALPDGWFEARVPWSHLNPSLASVDRIVIHAKTPVGADWVLLDKIGVTDFDAKAAALAVASAPSRGATLTVDCKAPGHAISPGIYGVAGDVTPDLNPSARRWGGNRTTRYNWQLQVSNVGSDWFFENTQGGSYADFLKADRAANAASALTVPTIGWVSKDATSYGFPVSVYGAQRAHDGYKSDAGDGYQSNGTPMRPKSPTQTSVAATPEFIRQWADTIQQADQKLGSRSVAMYILDNEPALWNHTHRDVHPDPVTYDELLDRTLRYSAAIRQGDPQALIAGPAEWGWTAYTYSAADTAEGVSGHPDQAAHGGTPLIEWYLQKLREHDEKTHTKSLDVLDVHYYPQGQDIYSGKSDPDTAALRIRSTRALWDPGYVDESWIKDVVKLVPRLKRWVAQNYPGLRTSIGEYNFGGENHMSGALALAEALGHFGTEGLDYAFYWTVPPKNSAAYWAFRSFRNFDGSGGQFLGESVPAKGDSDVTVFASRDASKKHLVIVTLNEDPKKSARARIALDGCGALSTRRKFTYGPHTDALADDGTKSGATLDELLPPYSINVFDVQLK